MATRAQAGLEVVGLTKHFGGLRVFEEISFTMPPGEILGVIGPNGAGKTTLINVISGKLAPTAGRVLLDRQDMAGRPLHSVSQAGIMRSFQQTNTFRSASVEENIARAITFSGGGQDVWRSLAGLLEEFELAPRLDEQSDKLPYGLQKMLGLILAFVARPKVLLLDEPAAGLEGRERERIDSFIKHAREQFGCSIMVVEHDMDLVRRLCPQILVLDAGRLLAAGPPAEVLARKDVIDAYVGAVDEEVA
ncbi:ABC transporter ATP-binding protein [Bosea thiooxidans]|nr:ABC transporter ATP-binding protein [Bosea sp. (in: a-proteobacteria)]